LLAQAPPVNHCDGAYPEETKLAKTVDYYFSLNSPWTYFGHERFAAMAQRHGADIKVKPVSYDRIFPASGGLPLPKRAPQRQAYRLVELQRWREHLGIPLNLQPPFNRVPGEMACCAVIAADRQGQPAMKLAGALMRAVWVEDRDIFDTATVQSIARDQGIKADLADAGAKSVYDAYTQEAIDRGVFGAPTYVYKDELFWGQDRLEFLDRALAK
jgi:2-hydroxychromene-2-carboxylate isomerase